MAHNCRTIPAHPETVFEFLIDPDTYPRWLIGAEEVRAVDRGWPNPGSRFHHTVGIGPFRYPDASRVVAIEAPNRLVLSVRASPLVRAIVTFELRGDEHATVLCLQEEPETRVIGDLVRPVMDPLTHVRNHRSLANFARVVAERSPDHGVERRRHPRP